MRGRRALALALFLSVSVILFHSPAWADCSSCGECPPPDIGFASKQMSVNGTQNLTASGGGGSYTWALVGGGGSLSGSGNSVAYTAPATNPGCGQNPFIQVTDSCGHATTLNLAINAVTNKNWNDTAYLVSWCEGPTCNCYPDACEGYGGGYGFETAAGLKAYFCDGTENGGEGRGCNSCFQTCCGPSCGCLCPNECDTCAGRFATGEGDCKQFTEGGQYLDKRSADKLNAGCCPAATSTCLNIGSLSTNAGAVNLSSGHGAITGKINANSGGAVSWSVSVAGQTITGSGSDINAVWDGKDGSGNQVQPGTYPATVTARTSGGSCSDVDSKSVTLTVTTTPVNCLDKKIDSTVNVASGNLHHSQTLFRMPFAKYLGEFVLSYESFNAETAPLGRGWTHTFNIKLKQNNNGTYTVIDGDGTRSVLYLNGTQYRPLKASYPALTLNGNGTYNLVYKDGMTYQFNQGFLVTGISDRNSNTVGFTYDAGGNLTGITDTSGRSIALTYDQNHRIGTITDANGNVHTFTYTGSQLTGLSSQIVQLGVSAWSYTYDAGGFMATKTDPNSNTTTYAYDGSRRVHQVTDPESRVRTIDYYPPQSYSRITDKDGGLWTYQYDAANGTLIQLTDPLGNQTTYAYDGWNLQSVMDPRGHTTRYTYDAYQNVASLTDARSFTIQYLYNSLNLVSRIDYLDPTGYVSAYLNYDAYGNLTSLTDPMNHTTQYAYDSRGNLLSITDALSRTTSFTYNAGNYLLTVADPVGTTTFTYDAAGNAASRRDPQNNLTGFTYNGLNKIRTVTDPQSHTTTYVYDAAGNVQSVTDANGNTTQYLYNYNGRVTRITDALGSMTDFSYGSGCQYCGTGVDQLTSVTDPRGYMTVFQYDPAGRLDGEYDPRGYARTYTYDAAGNVASMTDESNRTTHYQYDELNRLVQATYPDNTTKTLSYTARGKLATAANANLGYGFTYDAADRLTAVARSDGRNIGYQYDAANRRTQMTTPDGRTFIYSYDTAGRLAQITLGANAFTFTYDTAGRRTGLAYPNGVSTTYTYNPSSYLTSVLARYNQQNTTDSFAYTHDNVGNRATMTDLVGEHGYTYDYTYQLLSAAHPDTATETYTYDAAGNRLSASVDEENAPAGTATAYGYDYENRLIQAALPGTTAQYKYDPFGRRIEKSVNNVITSYLYDGPNIVTEYDGNGNVQAQYTHNLAVDDPLSVQQGASIYYYHKDGLGSVRDLTSSAGNVVKRYKYRTFGEIYSETGTLVQPYTFTAREKDPETGLYYYRARYYDPKAGRFIAKDPIGFAGGDANLYGYVDSVGKPLIIETNLYRYTANNPVNRIDPSGNTGQEIELAIKMALPLIFLGADIATDIPKKLGSAYDVLGLASGVSGVFTYTLIAETSSSVPLLIPVLGAFASGVEIGLTANRIYERISGQSLGEDIYDWTHPQAQTTMRPCQK